MRDDILEFQKETRPLDYKIFSQLAPLNIKKEDIDMVAKKTIDGIYDGISTTEIDVLSAEIAQDMGIINPENSTLATRLLVSNIQKNVVEILLKRFQDVDRKEIHENLFKYSMNSLYFNLDQKGESSPLIAPYLCAIANKYSNKINQIINFAGDFSYDYLGIKTLEKGYLFKVHSMPNFSLKDILIETPAISDMRIAIGIICSPIPCPNYYEKTTVLSFLLDPNNKDIFKEKSFDENSELKQDVINCKEPHKSSYLKTDIFKSRYWIHLLNTLQDIHVSDDQWERIKEIYEGMSLGKFTPATPTRFSMGKLRPQGSSCFLLAMQDDSLKGIYDTLTEQSQISKYAGGIGVWVSNIRCSNSYIAGTNGHSNGLKPMLKVFDATSAYVDQGGGLRPGTCAVYCEIWHADIMDFIKLKRKKGADSDRARNLFYALWICDEFFRCLKAGKDFYLFDPIICPKLIECYDEDFSSEYLSDEFLSNNKDRFLFTYRYRKYVKQKKYLHVISADKIIEEIVETVRDSGIPYMLSKDACNRKSNQKNIGVIKSSNLCAEIVEYSNAEETAVCNLSSVCLNKFTRPFREGDDESFKYDASLSDVEDFWTFDFEELGKNVRIIQKYLDRLIDLNFYPTKNAQRSNSKTRPQGTGLQGESDMLAKLRLPWNSKEANRLRFYIMERMYYEALKSSCEMSEKDGPYESFSGSPASKGELQFDLWRKEGKKISFPLSLDWSALKERIKLHGLKNSLFIALMPTASTSDIMGNNPSIEPFNSLVYIRKTGTGDVAVIKKCLVNDLNSIGLWNKDMRDKILSNHGSIQNILEIPKKLRNSYLITYDLDPEDCVDASFVRGWFVDQSQSMNLFFQNVTMAACTKAWTRGWLRGLKTLSYYCRTRTATVSQKAQISESKILVGESQNDEIKIEGSVCTRDDPNCLSCGS